MFQVLDVDGQRSVLPVGDLLLQAGMHSVRRCKVGRQRFCRAVPFENISNSGGCSERPKICAQGASLAESIPQQQCFNTANSPSGPVTQWRSSRPV